MRSDFAESTEFELVHSSSPEVPLSKPCLDI